VAKGGADVILISGHSGGNSGNSGDGAGVLTQIPRVFSHLGSAYFIWRWASEVAAREQDISGLAIPLLSSRTSVY
jgi:hypothetical protein